MATGFLRPYQSMIQVRQQVCVRCVCLLACDVCVCTHMRACMSFVKHTCMYMYVISVCVCVCV